MQIQKGLVKYKDRTDIVCTYGLTEEGKQYYFLDNTSLANGNIIASTVLVEAIDPVVVASSIGMIDVNGNVVIPFENKSIKPITEGLLLVEIANSTTPSVVEANNLRSDPLAATKLVTTPATIKENMNAKMGPEGRFVFNDQFSEATICDINGNNIIENKYFSFIAIKNNETLYFSKNTVDSPVVEFSLTDRMFVAQPEETAPLDVQNTEVTQDTIDGAMNAEEKVEGFNPTDITEKDFESVANGVPVENVVPAEGNAETLVEDATSPVEAESQDVSAEEVVADDSEEPISVIPEAKNVEEAPVEEVPEHEQEFEEVDDPLQLDIAQPEEVVETPEEVPSEAVEENPPVVTPDENSPVEEVETEPVAAEESEVNTEDVVNEATDDKLMSFDFADSINYSNDVVEDKPIEDTVNEFKNDLFDTDFSSDIFADSTLKVDSINVDNVYSDFRYRVGNRDTIIEDVASTMSNLINLNKKQKQTIMTYEDKFERAAVAHKKVVEAAKGQIREIETLKAKLNNYDTIVTKLESKIQILESKIHDQEKMIISQNRELDSLRPQIEGKEELVRVLADAQSLLDQI